VRKLIDRAGDSDCCCSRADTYEFGFTGEINDSAAEQLALVKDSIAWCVDQCWECFLMHQCIGHDKRNEDICVNALK
jgi:hypothetical protein